MEHSISVFGEGDCVVNGDRPLERVPAPAKLLFLALVLAGERRVHYLSLAKSVFGESDLEEVPDLDGTTWHVPSKPLARQYTQEVRNALNKLRSIFPKCDKQVDRTWRAALVDDQGTELFVLSSPVKSWLELSIHASVSVDVRQLDRWSNHDRVRLASMVNSLRGPELLSSCKTRWIKRLRSHYTQVLTTITDYITNRNGGSPPTNVPEEVGQIIAREADLETVAKLVIGRASACITGSKGCGKSTLAQGVARRLRLQYDTRFADGVFYVRLPRSARKQSVAESCTSDQIAQQVASVLDPRNDCEHVTATSQAEELCTRRLAVFVDNCELYVEAYRAWATTLLERCPLLRVVAISQVALRLTQQAAEVFQIQPLSYPDPSSNPLFAEIADAEAVRVFMLHAPDGFILDEENAPGVLDVCDLCGGLPYDIAVAAGQLAPSGCLTIDQLPGSLRTRMPREWEESIAWSINLLDERERELLYRLSVFTGGWSVEAAEAICADAIRTSGITIQPRDIVDLLTRLKRKSLIEEVRSSHMIRHRLRENVRNFALDNLRQTTEVRQRSDRHLHYYTHYCESVKGDFRGPNQVELLQRIAEEHGNIKSALRRSIDGGNVAPALRMVAGIWNYWWLRGFWSEGLRWIEEVLRLPDARRPSLDLAEALNAAGLLKRRLQQLDEASIYLDEGITVCLELRSDFDGQAELDRMLARLYNNKGTLCLERKDPTLAGHFYDLSMEYALASDYRVGQATVIQNLGELHLAAAQVACTESNEPDAIREVQLAEALFMHAIDLNRSPMNPAWLATNYVSWGDAARFVGHYQLALNRYYKAFVIRENLRSRYGLLECVQALTKLAHAVRARPIEARLDDLANIIPLGDDPPTHIWRLAQRLILELEGEVPPDPARYELASTAART